MLCTAATGEHAMFEMPGGTLTISQRGPEIIRKGEHVRITCTSQIIKANGYGLFVDYEFTVYETGGSVIINGPDAQSLIRRVKPTRIKNRDVPLLCDTLAVLQLLCKAEELREWQRERMVKITAGISGMPGGGGAKGLDEALAALDEMDRSELVACKDYARHLRRVERVLNGIESLTMRSFVTLKYVAKAPDAEIRRVLNLTRRGYDRARKCVEEAEDMASVKWQERYILDDAQTRRNPQNHT